MNSELSGKVVIVTGASGGIGSATARKFAAEGARAGPASSRQPRQGRGFARRIAGRRVPRFARRLDQGSGSQTPLRRRPETVRPPRHTRRQRRLMGDARCPASRNASETMALDPRCRADLLLPQPPRNFCASSPGKNTATPSSSPPPPASLGKPATLIMLLPSPPWPMA